MSVRVVASRVIPAAAAVCYGLIADYRVGHPSILPPAYFRDLVVEEGGYGAGTRIRFTMIAYGKRTETRAVVTEPEPGRALLETDEATGTTTLFTIEPLSPTSCRVTFDTTYPTAGSLGWLVAIMVRRYLKKVYAAELGQLARVATGARAL